jgi:hypothetical protein
MLVNSDSRYGRSRAVAGRGSEKMAPCLYYSLHSFLVFLFLVWRAGRKARTGSVENRWALEDLIGNLRFPSE